MSCRRGYCNNPKSLVVGHYGRCVQCHEASVRERIAKEERRQRMILVRERRAAQQELNITRRQERKEFKIKVEQELAMRKIRKAISKFTNNHGLVQGFEEWDYEASNTTKGKEIIEILKTEINQLLHPPKPSGEYECSVCYKPTDILTSCQHPVCNSCQEKIHNKPSLHNLCPLCRAPTIFQARELRS